MGELLIRKATPDDLPALTDIYNHYVRTTPITFDIEPRTLEQRREWLKQFAGSGPHHCFVAVEQGVPVGWASSARLKEKAAYDTSVETSIYLSPDRHGRGLGRTLYETLFAALAGHDIHRAYAGITLPNAASVALHKSFGFNLIGQQHEVGRKFGKFWDVGLYERKVG